jgi:hypothetical protein
MTFRNYRVRQIVDTHDGDTITAHLDLGLDQCHQIHLRLLGVFAAELHTAGGPAAKTFTAGWLADRGTHPLTCWTLLSKGGVEQSTLGRWVGDIHDDTTGESLCAAAMAWLIANPTSAGGTGAP